MFSVTQISQIAQIFFSPAAKRMGSHRNHGKHRKRLQGGHAMHLVAQDVLRILCETFENFVMII